MSALAVATVDVPAADHLAPVVELRPTRRRRSSVPVSVCEGCGRSFEPTRADARYCPGGPCRQRAYRARRRNGGQPPSEPGAGISDAELVARYGAACPDIAQWVRRLAELGEWFEQVEGGYRMRHTRDVWLGRAWWSTS